MGEVEVEICRAVDRLVVHSWTVLKTDWAVDQEVAQSQKTWTSHILVEGLLGFDTLRSALCYTVDCLDWRSMHYLTAIVLDSRLARTRTNNRRPSICP